MLWSSPKPNNGLHTRKWGPTIRDYMPRLLRHPGSLFLLWTSVADCTSVQFRPLPITQARWSIGRSIRKTIQNGDRYLRCSCCAQCDLHRSLRPILTLATYHPIFLMELRISSRAFSVITTQVTEQCRFEHATAGSFTRNWSKAALKAVPKGLKMTKIPSSLNGVYPWRQNVGPLCFRRVAFRRDSDLQFRLVILRLNIERERLFHF